MVVMMMVVMMMVAANIIGFGGRAAAGAAESTLWMIQRRSGGLCIYLFNDVSRNFSPTLHIAFIMYNQTIDSISSDQYNSYLRIEIMKSFELWQLASGICVQCT